MERYSTLRESVNTVFEFICNWRPRSNFASVLSCCGSQPDTQTRNRPAVDAEHRKINETEVELARPQPRIKVFFAVWS